MRSEYVIEVEGTVILRTEDQINPNVPNGKIEVEATKLVVINTAKQHHSKSKIARTYQKIYV